MRKLVISTLIFVAFNFISLAQNWLPLKVGNQWQYLVSSHYSSPGSTGVYSHSLDTLTITSDTIVSNKNYYKGLYGEGEYGLWSRYDSLEQKIYLWCDTTERLHMDFTLIDSSYSDFLTIPNYCIPWNYVWIYSYTDSFANSSVNIKSFGWVEDWGFHGCSYVIEYVDGLGIFNRGDGCFSMGGYFHDDNNKLIQCILGGQNISDNYSPEIMIQPDTTLSDSILNLTFQVKHKYNHIYPQGSQSTSFSFINQVLLHSFYSNLDTVANSTMIVDWVPDSEIYSLQVPLDMSLLEDGYKLYYKIEAIDKGLVPHRRFSPESGYYIAELDTTTDINDGIQNVFDFTLSQNYPNPFNPSTSIQYTVGSPHYVTLKVYDVLGNEVATLVNEEKPSGSYELEFDAEKLSSGVYYYRLKAGEFIQTKKMILLK